jgi:hypothetical protein
MSLEPLLEMQGISKTFNGLRVLKNVGLKVYPSVNVCACVPDALAGGVLDRGHGLKRANDQRDGVMKVAITP